MRIWTTSLFLLLIGSIACAQPAPQPATKPAGVGKFPNVTVDVPRKQVRVDCEFLNVDMRLEFFCTGPGGPDHETILRTAAKPSDVHTGLLMLGLTPGEPMKYSEAAQKWSPPHGPPLHITVEYQKDGKTVSYPANRLFRNAESKKVAPAFTWVFCGSRVMEDGKYAADITGYVVSLVNFDLTMIDVPNLASNSNDTLEWEYNPDTVPKSGTKAVMIIEPAGKDDKAAAVPAAVPDTTGDVVRLEVANGKLFLNGKPIELSQLADAVKPLPESTRIVIGSGLTGDTIDPVLTALHGRKIEFVGNSTTQPTRSEDVRTDEQAMAEWRAKWEKAVRPNAAALKQAAQAHYDAINAMRKEQQRLINEADRIQRVIDQLEKEYQDMTTPHPAD